VWNGANGLTGTIAAATAQRRGSGSTEIAVTSPPMTLTRAEAGAERLGVLIAGLLFVSESDAPLRVVRLGRLPALDESALLGALGKTKDTPIMQQSLGALFDRAVVDQPWHGPAERAAVERYRALLRFLGTELDGARVFRVGRIEVEAYALGRTSDGEWLGVTTTLVET
jgi:hypothetical protein